MNHAMTRRMGGDRPAGWLLVAMSLVPLANAQTAGTGFTYQGRLADAGSPANGPYDFQMVLYTAAAGGSPVGPVVTLGDVAVVDGLFTVNLDFGPGSFPGASRFLEIGVRPGASSGAYTVLSARQELKPAPHSVFSQQAPWAGITGKPPGFADDIDNDLLGGLSCVNGQVAKWNGAVWACAADADSGGDITGVTAGTGLTGGGTTGAVTLSASFGGGGTAATVSHSDHDHFGQTWAPSAAPAADGLTISTNNTAGNRAAVTGIHNVTSSPGYGLHGRTVSNIGVAVFGEATASAAGAAGIGMWGTSASPIGTGVLGAATATSGGNYGVYGYTNSSNGRGVFGESTAAVGASYGVHGTSASTQGIGVWGESTATTGASWGVRGTSTSTTGRGVFGESTTTTGPAYGVLGESYSTQGRAVYGRALATSGTNYGIYGATSSAAGYAGYFDGRVHVNGILSKGAGSFKIDHPLDPENKYLSHSFVESPDMMNVYNGNVTTDGDGYATVGLPDWFEALNRDFRYQLTVLDEGDSAVFVQAKVVKKVAGNRFTIRSSMPRTEVSWQVTGIRKDRFAERHRILVEEPKPEGERGTYLNPAEGGAPEESTQ